MIHEKPDRQPRCQPQEVDQPKTRYQSTALTATTAEEGRQCDCSRSSGSVCGVDKETSAIREAALHSRKAESRDLAG